MYTYNLWLFDDCPQLLNIDTNTHQYKIDDFNSYNDIDWPWLAILFDENVMTFKNLQASKITWLLFGDWRPKQDVTCYVFRDFKVFLPPIPKQKSASLEVRATQTVQW